MNAPIIRNYEEITLDSDTFQGIRENFDLLFQRLFKKMEQVNSDEGSITLKIDVTMQEDFVPDENGVNRAIHKPVIKHKISTAVPVKDSFDGKKETGMDLVYDEDLKRYVLRYVNVGGQRSIFDPDFMLPDNADGEPEDAQEADSGMIDVPDEENPDGDFMTPQGGDTEAQEGDDEYDYDEPEEE